MSPDIVARPPLARSRIGRTMLFDTMVERAIAATITMEVADENPPRNEAIASPSCPSASGSVRTKRSGFEPGGSTASPTTAIGTTKRLMSRR